MDLFSPFALQPPVAQVSLRGELDAFSGACLRMQLDRAVDRGCLRFTVDASDVSFIDAGGLAALVWLNRLVASFAGPSNSRLPVPSSAA